MISKCSLTTLLLINALFVCAQKKQVEGVWKTQDQQDSLLVCASGSSNPAVFVYFPGKAKFLPFTFGTGDDLIHYEPDASKMVLTVSADGKTITDAASLSGKKVYSRTSTASPVNCKDITATPDDFFDYSTTNYYAGINFYLSSHPGLPFMPNSAFVTKHKTSSVKIEKIFSRISPDGVQAQKEFDLVYNFNPAGQITTVQVIPYNAGGQETDTWTFAYNGDKLQRISSPGRVLQFDNDNWEVDVRQQKKVPFIFPMWSYYDDSKPHTATLPYMTGAPLNEYFYNESNQLVRICSKDVSEPNILEHCTEYTYDKNGLPTKIVETKRSK